MELYEPAKDRGGWTQALGRYAINETQAEALAWSGLDSTVAWLKLDEDIKEIYKDIFENEITGFDILAVGKSCD